MNTKYIIGIVLGVIILLGAFVIINSKLNGTVTTGPDLSSLAICLKSSGTVMYGAFWCPHCAATKKMFGDAAHFLPYHECSTPDGNSQLPDCTAKGVQGYPTWVFPDGSRLTGEASYQTLAARAGCSLPVGVATTSGYTTATASTSASGASSAVQ